MPRLPGVRALRLAGAAIVVAAFAGCGTAMASTGDPIWAAAVPAASNPAPAVVRPVVTRATVTKPPVPVHTTTAPAEPEPDEHIKSGSGPAKSLMKTGTAGVALTFDDGPDPAQTPKILDLLAEYHVHATFCLVGQNVAAHPDLVRRIVAEGHTVCNHTWRHSLTLGRQKPAEIRADLQRTNDAILAAAPDAKIKYLRAPGGNFSPDFVKVAAELGMTSIYWQVDPRDWDHPAGESDAAHEAKVITAIKSHTRSGSIVLSHDYGQPDTIAAYRILLPWLQNHFKLIALP
jgi:peptidoglycan/xylan/chitin deacetylase (PgdA/CDA1 family)